MVTARQVQHMQTQALAVFSASLPARHQHQHRSPAPSQADHQHLSSPQLTIHIFSKSHKAASFSRGVLVRGDTATTINNNMQCKKHPNLVEAGNQVGEAEAKAPDPPAAAAEMVEVEAASPALPPSAAAAQSRQWGWACRRGPRSFWSTGRTSAEHKGNYIGQMQSWGTQPPLSTIHGGTQPPLSTIHCKQSK